MSFWPKEGYRKGLVAAAYAILGAGALVITLRYLLPPFLPFLLAWLAAMLLRPLVNRISDRTGLPRRGVSFVLVLLLLLLLSALLIAVFGRVIAELRGLAERLMSDAAGAVGDIFDYLGRLSEKLPFLDGIEDREAAERVQQTVISMVEGAVASFSARIPEAVIGFIGALPGILLFSVVLVAATFYMGSDVTRINGAIASLIPASSRHHLFEAKRKLATAGVRYIRAYLLILFITFVQLLIGFLCLKIPYALTLAAVIALIDILPVLGVGTALLPWAAVLLIRGDTYTGVGLLIVFGVIWTVRQFIEPKIVGQSTGLPPLLTLIAMYTGYRFMGVSGLFLFPPMLILLKNLLDIGVLRPGRAGGDAGDQKR